MTIRSREIILTVNAPNEGGVLKAHAYRLRGIEKVSYAFQPSIASEQGLAANFVHPWFLKVFTISLSGHSFIGDRNDLKDDVATQGSQDEPEAANAKLNFIQSVGDWFKRSWTQKPTVLAPGSYYKYQEFNRLVRDIMSISEVIRGGKFAAFNTSNIVQTLEIKNYSDTPQDDLKFSGFISKLQVSESSKVLGVLDYDLEFTGIVSSLSSVNAGVQNGEQRNKEIQANGPK
jgi:hypothetical protein